MRGWGEKVFAMNRTSLLFVIACVIILSGLGTILFTSDHSVDHNVPGKSTGAGRNAITSPERPQ